uniref:Protein krueppel n=1 Tax=Glossina brevipalpis TaxID=37001 RepID=A0A1A9WDP5_9MUSC
MTTINCNSYDVKFCSLTVLYVGQILINLKMSGIIKDLCRTCMWRTNDDPSYKNRQHIYENLIECQESSNFNLMELLQLIAPQIKIQMRDGLPEFMCMTCIHSLRRVYDFLRMYTKSDELYRQMLKDHNYRNSESEEKLSKHRKSLGLNREMNLRITQEEDVLKENLFTYDEYTLIKLNEENGEYIEESMETSYGQENDSFFNQHEKEGGEGYKRTIKKNSNIIRKQKEESTKVQTINAVEIKAKPSEAKKNFECEYCDKVFTKSTNYKNHVRTHTGEQPFLCIECGKGFSLSSSLNTHMKRHRGEKCFQCPDCPKQFVCASGLYAHRAVHQKERPFICDICGSAFHQAYQLKKHCLYHSGIKNFSCDYCDMRFFSAEKKRRHIRTHTGEKPYSCKYCDRAFAQSNDCIKHLRSHLGENVYQCEMCPLRFPLARDLRAHFASHKNDDEETRMCNLQARKEEEHNLKIKLGIKEV